jgi:hypothetical protein
MHGDGHAEDKGFMSLKSGEVEEFQIDSSGIPAQRQYEYELREDTYMYRLTLSVDAAVAVRAKRYAKERGVSLSKMIEAYLSAVAEGPEVSEDPPILQLLRDVLKKSTPEEYRRRLAGKYR